MKKQTILMLSLLSSSLAHAADLVPTQIKAIETDLARADLKLQDEYAYRLGLNFVQGRRYSLDPTRSDVESSSNIRREINFSLMLPMSIETGVALYDTQQASAQGATVKHKSQKVGGALWARYHLIQSESLNSSVILQYEPGTADRNSFHQASQDKTTFAVHLDGSPFAYTQAGVYLGASTRKDESFRGSRLNNEILYGTRVSLGNESMQVFGDAQFRSLSVDTNGSTSYKTSRLYEAGISVNYGDIGFQASSFIPTTERYFGVPERGIKVGLQMVFGGKSPAPLSKATEEKTSAALPTVESGDDLNGLSAADDTQELGAVPVVDTEVENKSDEIKSEPLTLPGADEFQKWDALQANEKTRPETDAERAEREYKLQMAQEKVQEAAKAAQDTSARDAEEARLRKELDLDSRDDEKTKAEIEKEINQYTLPDQDDVTWDGLNK